MRKEVIFTGRVQGVGFRYEVKSFADDRGLVGWVRNCSDGNVQMLVEGDEAIIDGLIKALQARFMIRDMQVSLSQAKGDLHGFEITY